MKTIAQILAYIITNIIVAQSVFVSEENLVWNNSIQLPNTLKFNPSKEIKKSDIPILILFCRLSITSRISYLNRRNCKRINGKEKSFRVASK